MLTQSVIAIMAFAAMAPAIVGQFDVSIGYQLGLSQSITAILALRMEWNPVVAGLVAIAACLIVGTVNGILVVKVGLNSFIATLASGTVLLGLTQWLTGDATITGRLPEWFTGFVRDRSLVVPASFLIVIVITAVLWIVYEYTSWGRSAHAVGSNAKASGLSGINVQLTTFASFLISALLAGIAGMMSVAVLGASSPTVGLGQLLPAFAAAFLGSTAIRPGRFNAIGTLVAVLVLAAGITGLQQLGLDFYVQQLFNGGALLIAITISAVARKRRRS